MELQSETILDLKAFNRLFGEYQQRFIRFAGTYVSDAATAEDIVMESFMAAWEKRDMLSASAFPPYALTIVKNKCLNHLRSQGVRLRAAEDIHSHGARMLRTRISTLEACNPEELFSEEARRLVNETLDRLPERPARSLSAAASTAKAIRRSPPKWALRSRASSSKSRRR